MSILHTLVPVRVGSVGLKPTKKFLLKLQRVRPDGTCECRRCVTCAMNDAWTESSRHRMSQETVTGRFPSLLPGRRRLSTVAVKASGGSVSTFRGLRIRWVGGGG
ncbi:hypothetical protein EVAR_36647_1 [Eumeta japonica]|uniref:Uncharacterized protein n=1 Tax=Eumeta variegata TaxID=151549 RepID=A0A4C1YQA5_EUMVA|nr:hypothetical protein EVAR_36647_1 [Eumeta japonica]